MALSAGQLQAHCVKTKMCRFHVTGFCSKGTGCKFAHDAEELRSAPQLAYTKVCPRLVRNGACDEPTCRFAHTREQLRRVSLAGGRQMAHGEAEAPPAQHQGDLAARLGLGGALGALQQQAAAQAAAFPPWQQLPMAVAAQANGGLPPPPLLMLAAWDAQAQAAGRASCASAPAAMAPTSLGKDAMAKAASIEWGRQSTTASFEDLSAGSFDSEAGHELAAEGFGAGRPAPAPHAQPELLAQPPRAVAEAAAKAASSAMVATEGAAAEGAASALPRRVVRNKFFRTKMCTFFAQGLCKKKNSCSFAHTEAELTQLPDLRCTKLCPSLLGGECPGADCTFAHSAAELRGDGPEPPECTVIDPEAPRRVSLSTAVELVPPPPRAGGPRPALPLPTAVEAKNQGLRFELREPCGPQSPLRKRFAPRINGDGDVAASGPLPPAAAPAPARASPAGSPLSVGLAESATFSMDKLAFHEPSDINSGADSDDSEDTEDGPAMTHCKTEPTRRGAQRPTIAFSVKNTFIDLEESDDEEELPMLPRRSNSAMF